MAAIGQPKTTEENAVFWEGVWKRFDVPAWQKMEPHHCLQKYFPSLKRDGATDLQIFFPLCGKTVDMKWLSDQGVKVVGVEFVEKVIEEYFNENALKFNKSSNEGATLYQTEDGGIKIFSCDILNFNSTHAGQMDAIFDRASLIALEKEDRKRYVEVSKNLLKPGGKILLEVIQYDDFYYSGPPRTVPEKLIRELYGDWCKIEFLESVEATERIQQNLRNSPVHWTTYLLTRI